MSNYSYDEIKNNICNTIVEKMKQYKYSASDLAKMLNISGQSVSRYVNHMAVPSLDIMLEICNIFNITINDLCKINNDELINSINSIPNLDLDLQYIIKTKKAPTVEELQLLDAIKSNPEIMNLIKSVFDKNTK